MAKSANALGVSKTTVGAAREDLEAGVQIEHLSTSVGKDGKVYPRKKASRIEAEGTDQQAVTAGG